MKTMSTRLLGTLLIALLMTSGLLAGCGNKASRTESQAQNKIILKFANGQTVNSIANMTMVDMAKEVAEKSKGQVEIQVYPANQLGNERELAEGLRMGTIDMAYVSQAVMENFEPKLGLFSLPFLFNNQEHAEKVVNGAIGRSLYDNLLKQQGIRVFGSWRQNFRFVFSNKPIARAEDFKGLKIRVPESPTYVNTFKALGSNPTPLPWGEVYTSMQTGVVDAFEVQSTSVGTEKLYEVSKYMAKTHHIMASSLVMVNEKKWQSLPPDVQKIISEAAANAQKANFDKQALAEEQDLKLFKEKGMGISEFSPEDRQKLVSAVQSVWQEVPEKLKAEDLMQQIIQAGK
ncbi:MAG: TRAP transporter substrate-binding protein [Negativicutes bacterium]|nr:TRAP transporter substrate-binding protein [Negativicutes bacterium]